MSDQTTKPPAPKETGVHDVAEFYKDEPAPVGMPGLARIYRWTDALNNEHDSVLLIDYDALRAWATAEIAEKDADVLAYIDAAKTQRERAESAEQQLAEANERTRLAEFCQAGCAGQLRDAIDDLERTEKQLAEAKENNLALAEEVSKLYTGGKP